MTRLRVYCHTEQLAVCRLPADQSVPDWAAAPGKLRAAIRSTSDLSIVCAVAAVPVGVRHEGPFTAFQVEGPLDLALTGVLAALLAPLAAAEVSVFTLSTFDTNWVLVPSMQHQAASKALQRAGHTVQPADSPQNPGQLPGRTPR